MTAQEAHDAIVEAVESARRHARPDPFHDGYDFNELLVEALVAVAVNVGGVEPMVASRPGSWEADLIRQLLVAGGADFATF